MRAVVIQRFELFISALENLIKEMRESVCMIGADEYVEDLFGDDVAWRELHHGQNSEKLTLLACADARRIKSEIVVRSEPYWSKWKKYEKEKVAYMSTEDKEKKRNTKKEFFSKEESKLSSTYEKRDFFIRMLEKLINHLREENQDGYEELIEKFFGRKEEWIELIYGLMTDYITVESSRASLTVNEEKVEV